MRWLCFALLFGSCAYADESNCQSRDHQRVCQFNLKSDHMSSSVLIKAIGPSHVSWKGLPVLFYLHGRGGGAGKEQWFQMNAVGLFDHMKSKLYQNSPFVVVAPQDLFVHLDDGSESHGQDYWLGPDSRRDWESFISKTLISFVKDEWGLGEKPCQRIVAGISMGAHGALSLGTKYKNLFAGLGAHSPIFRVEPRDVKVSDEDVFGGSSNLVKFHRRSFGYRLVYDVDKLDLSMPMFIDIAPEDYFQEVMCPSGMSAWKKLEQLSEKLSQNSIIYQGASPDGSKGHSYEYWSNMASEFYFPWYHRIFSESCVAN